MKYSKIVTVSPQTPMVSREILHAPPENINRILRFLFYVVRVLFPSFLDIPRLFLRSKKEGVDCNEVARRGSCLPPEVLTKGGGDYE